MTLSIAVTTLCLIGLFLVSVTFFVYTQNNLSATTDPIRTSRGLNQTFIEKQFKNIRVPNMLGAIFEPALLGTLYGPLSHLPYHMQLHFLNGTIAELHLNSTILKALNQSITENHLPNSTILKALNQSIAEQQDRENGLK